MSYEEAYVYGKAYAENGLTIKEYNAIIEYLRDHFGQMIAHGFHNGYMEN